VSYLKTKGSAAGAQTGGRARIIPGTERSKAITIQLPKSTLA